MIKSICGCSFSSLFKVLGPRWKLLHFKGQNLMRQGANKVGGKPSSSSGKSLLVLAPMPGFPGKYDQPQRSDHQSYKDRSVTILCKMNSRMNSNSVYIPETKYRI